MNITFGEINNASDSIAKLLQQDVDITVAIKLKKLAKSLEVELSTLEEARVKLVKEHSENGETVSEERRNEFVAKYQELMNKEVEVDVTTLNVNDLKGTKLSGVDLMKLEKFLNGV